MRAQTSNLNLVPGGVPVVVTASQYDEGRTYTFTIYDGTTDYTIPADAVVTVSGRKQDRKAFSYGVEDGAVAVSDDRKSVTITTTQQMTCIHGDVMCELTISSGDGVIGTANFTIAVEPAPINDETVVSDTELPAIIEGAKADAARAERAAEAAEATVEAVEAKVDEAEAAADRAAEEATKAGVSAAQASGYVQDAAAQASNAADSATAAAQSAADAAQSVTDAAAQVTAAAQEKAGAEAAKTDAETAKAGAETARDDAEDFATLAESWAHGGTGTRTGEETDNAEYWAGQAQGAADAEVARARAWAVGPDGTGEGTAANNAKFWADKAKEIVDAASAGVSSFNGRTGVVEPQSGDYTAEMIGIGIATTEDVGLVKPDGSTITIDADGTLHGASQVPSGVTYVKDTTAETQAISDLAYGSNIKLDATYNDLPIIMTLIGKNQDAADSVTLLSKDILCYKPMDAMEATNSQNTGARNYGNGKYSVSNLSQWLQSDTAAGGWYSAQHTYDAPPTSGNVKTTNGVAENPYYNEAGFLHDWPDYLKNSLITTSQVDHLHANDEGSSGAETLLPFDARVWILYINNFTGQEVDGRAYPYLGTLAMPDWNPTSEALARSTVTPTKTNVFWGRGRYSYSGNYAQNEVSTTTGNSKTTQANSTAEYAYNGTIGVVPAIALPNTMRVTTTPDSDGYYTIVQESSSEHDVLYTKTAGGAERAVDLGIPDVSGYLKKDGSIPADLLTIGERAGTAGGKSLTVGEYDEASTNYSIASGWGSKASGYAAVAEGCVTSASGSYAHAEGCVVVLSTTGTITGTNGGKEWTADDTLYSAITSADYYKLSIRVNGHVHPIKEISEEKVITLYENLTITDVEDGAETSATANVVRSPLASGYASHAEGGGSLASGQYAHAEGNRTNATGASTHAEGYITTASGKYAHAEGASATASGNAAHAEGSGTAASGIAAHAEGSQTTATGNASHASGLGTTAGYTVQTVMGQYNENKSTSLVEVGNGTAGDARSNALELDTSGNLNIAGIYKKNGAALAVSDLAATGTAGQVLGFTADNTIGAMDSTTPDMSDYLKKDGSVLADKLIISSASGGDFLQVGTRNGSYTPGDKSSMVGYYNAASGNYSMAQGSGNIASGYCSSALGQGTKAPEAYKTAIGCYNDPKTNTFFEVGRGINDTNRINAMEVYTNGNVNITGEYQQNGASLIRYGTSDIGTGATLVTGTLYCVYEA